MKICNCMKAEFAGLTTPTSSYEIVPRESASPSIHSRGGGLVTARRNCLCLKFHIESTAKTLATHECARALASRLAIAVREADGLQTPH